MTRRGSIPVSAVVVLATWVASACGNAPASAEAGPSMSDGAEPVAITLTAQDIAYAPATFTVPAGHPLQVTFHNRDNGVPHNVTLMAGPALATELVKSEIITGVADLQITIPGLVPGAYQFMCSVHPNMTAPVTVAG